MMEKNALITVLAFIFAKKVRICCNLKNINMFTCDVTPILGHQMTLKGIVHLEKNEKKLRNDEEKQEIKYHITSKSKKPIFTRKSTFKCQLFGNISYFSP